VIDLVDIEEVRAHLNLGSDTSHDSELLLYIDAASEHVDDRYGAVDVPVPASLKLAVLEDIRGLYQPGQLGPLAEFGAFGTQTAESTDTGPGYRPVRLWPRIDAWIVQKTSGPAVTKAPSFSFPTAPTPAWPDPADCPAWTDPHRAP
jgi:hypothetical protein